MYRKKMKEKNGRLFEGPSVRPRRGRNYGLTYDLMHRHFARVCSRMQSQVAENWLRLGRRCFRPNRGGQDMLNRYLKGRIHAHFIYDAAKVFYSSPPCKCSLRRIAVVIFQSKYRRSHHFDSTFILLARN